MELQTRRLRSVNIQEQENVHVIKGKTNLVPAKKQGLAVRGALGDLNTNAQAQRVIGSGKVAVTTAEFEKKSTMCRTATNSYSHVQSKVDSGRALKPIQPSARPPLRREESTAKLAVKASVRSLAAKESSRVTDKENMGVLPTKKVDFKKPTKLAPIKENIKVTSTTTLKPILKEPTESLGKLRIEEKPSIIDMNKLKNHPTLKKTEKQVEKQSVYSNYLDNSVVLPEDIEDIDAADCNRLTLMPIYIKDIYRYLRELEDRFPIEQDYLKNQTEILPRMRAMLIDWLVQVHQEFKQQQESLHLTVAIIDRYLQVAPNVRRSNLQLIGVTAMFLACKYEEVYPPDISDFVYVAANVYTKRELLRCEQDIFMKLGFCLAKPIPLWFLRRFVKAAHGDSKRHNLSKYFVELCFVEYSMVHYKPSELAAAALCLSLHLLSGKSIDKVWNSTLEYYTGYDVDHLLPIIKKIAKIVANAENSKCTAVFKKYQNISHSKVACLPELKTDNLYLLADCSPRH